MNFMHNYGGYLQLKINYQPYVLMFCQSWCTVSARAGSPGRHHNIPQVCKHRLRLPRESFAFSHPRNMCPICFNLLQDRIFGFLVGFWQKDKRRGKEFFSGYKSHFSFAKTVQHSGEIQGSRDENSVLRVRLVEELKLSWF